MEKIICAAIHYHDGINHPHQPINISTGFIVCGRGHHNCVATVSVLTSVSAAGLLRKMDKTEGFLTDTNRFLNREMARAVAFEAGQLAGKDVQSKTKLYSEDLY